MSRLLFAFLLAFAGWVWWANFRFEQQSQEKYERDICPESTKNSSSEPFTPAWWNQCQGPDRRRSLEPVRGKEETSDADLRAFIGECPKDCVTSKLGGGSCICIEDF